MSAGPADPVVSHYESLFNAAVFSGDVVVVFVEDVEFVELFEGAVVVVVVVPAVEVAAEVVVVVLVLAGFVV
jgi:ethanolamine utilization microcompartment shell protein EutS